MMPIGMNPAIHSRPPIKAADLQLNYNDGINSLLDVALLPGIDSVVQNSMTMGAMSPPLTQFRGEITSQAGTQTVEAQRNNSQASTTSLVGGDNSVEVSSQLSVEDGAHVQRGQFGDYHFESRTGFDAETGAFVNEGFIARGVTGDQISFRREMRQLPDRSGTSFTGHIGGLPESGTIKMDQGALLIDRQVGEYHIAGNVKPVFHGMPR